MVQHIAHLCKHVHGHLHDRIIQVRGTVYRAICLLMNGRRIGPIVYI